METEGPSIVVDDLLSFLAFKLHDCPKEDLLKCISDFYSIKTGQNSYKTLLSALPEKRKYLKLKDHTKKVDDPFIALYETFSQIASEDIPLFVCKNLNNVPISCTKEVKSSTKDVLKKSSSFMKEHLSIKNRITEVFHSLYQLQESVQYLSEKTSPVVRMEDNYISDNDETKPEDLSDYGDDDTDDEYSDDSSSEMDDFGDFPTEYLPPEDEVEEQIIDQTIDATDLKKEFDLDNFLEFDMSIPIDRTEEEENEDNFESAATVFFEMKHMFDTNIGYFTIYICSNCHYYSNHEQTMKKHNCLPNDATSNHELSIYNQLNFDKKRLQELQETDDKSRPKMSGVYSMPHRCPLCYNQFPLEDWLNHVRQCPGQGEDHRDSIYCTICDVFYADPSLLRYHANFHDETKPYECLQCKFRFTTQTEVDKHFTRHLPQQATNNKCPFCPFPLSKSASLMEHIRIHTGEKPFTCTVCKVSYRSKARLKVHEQRHKARQFSCPVCQKNFRKESTKLAHLKQHAVSRPYNCTSCTKVFKTEQILIRHMRRHLQSFTCPHCTYKSSSEDGLKEHINKHIRCFFCDFSTCSKASYRKHMRAKHEQDLLSC